MKDILIAIKNILLSNWHALAAIVLLSLILALRYDFNFILSLIIFPVVYFIAGCGIEYVRQSYIHHKKTTAGKSEEQLKKEAEIKERRRQRGMAILDEDKKKQEVPAERSLRYTVRRRSSYEPAEDKTSVDNVDNKDDALLYVPVRTGRRNTGSVRKRTPFDIEPPSDTVETSSDNSDFSEEAVTAEEKVTFADETYYEENSVPEFTEADETPFGTAEDDYLDDSEVSDADPAEDTDYSDVYVDAGSLDALYGESDYAAADKEETSVIDNEENSENDSEKTESVPVENPVYEPLTVNEIKQTSENLSNEIRSRVNSTRRHAPRIFDPYADEKETAAEEDVFGEKITDVPDADFDADYDFTPPSDIVDSGNDKLDELYSEKTREAEPKNKGNFITRAIDSLKKKEETEPEKIVKPVENEKKQAVSDEKLKFEHRPMYVYPSVDIVKPKGMKNGNSGSIGSVGPAEEEKAQKLVDTLKSFGIGVKITGITKGPAVTRFEFQPDIGVKISRIVSLTDDIALNLAASGVRMEAPIPGKSAIGIEIPNETIDTVYLYNVLNSDAYKNAASKIAFALGIDLNGNVVIGDIAKMPHMLIAGSTGSGKSVCINTIITSILYGASPDEVKFIMIDPKVVELGIYNGIPHLLIPVVTEPKKASAALAWAVKEVDRRYNVFAECNVRDLKSYNNIAEKSRGRLPKEPQIVIIVDELADLMMAASHDVETSIIRLAQKARAAGVHLVIATQRPSVDVITGLIKANIPSRIAFAVASQFDSRTILDTQGAEKLLGRGDMLYMPIGQPKAMRVQGAFVSDEEVEKLVEFIKSSYGTAYYSEEVVKSIETSVAESVTVRKGGDDTAEDDADADLIQEAADLAFEFNQLSASFLQRKMKIGFNRAGRIIDTLEERGLLSKSEGSKPRQVIMTREEWDNL